MKTILPILPKVVYSVDLEPFALGNMVKNPSYLSYLSYLTFFVHLLVISIVAKIVILSTPHTPCTKINSTEKGRKTGKIISWVRSKIPCYLSPNTLIAKDKKAV